MPSQDLPKNPKIGRPIKTSQGQEFKREYQVNETKFELECELLVTIHENYFVEPPTDSQNRRVEIDYLTALFEKHNALDIYKTLLALNEFYYKNSSIFPEDKLRYTSIIDIAYMFKHLKQKMGNVLRTVDCVLTVIFYLYNEKLINYKFYLYIEDKIDKIAIGMLEGMDKIKEFDKIMNLIMILILQISSKEDVKLRK